MLTVRVQNSRNQTLTLNNQESKYQIVSIDGLQPPRVSINTTPIATADGSIFASARMGNRNIVIQVRINGDVESNRLDLYKYFVVKEKVTLYFKTASRNLKIDGYVESVECPLFTNSEIMQISVICPNPYFTNVSQTSAFIGSGLQIANVSNVPMGMHFEISASGGSFQTITITNSTTGEYITLTHTGAYYETHGEILIDTIDLEKSVTYITPVATVVNAFADVVIGSTFLQIAPFATNTLVYTIDGSADNNYKATVNVKYAPFYKEL